MGNRHHDLFGALTREIVCGARRCGDVLTTVHVTSERGVGRGLAREAVRALEERGLVTVEHGSGARINGPESWNRFDPVVLAAMLEAGYGPELRRTHLECRRIVDVQAAGLAAARARNRDRDAMAVALDWMEVAASWPDVVGQERFHEAERAFHRALIAAARNPPLAHLADRVHRALALVVPPLDDPEDHRDRALSDHRRILEAVDAGDVRRARDAMRSHLVALERHLSGRPEARARLYRARSA